MAQSAAPLPEAAGPGGASSRYVLPFVLFLVVLALLPHTGLNDWLAGPIWFLIFIPVCLACWPRSLRARPSHWFSSIAVGLLVFVLWIAPDVLLPGYRNGPLFSNAIFGHVHSSLSSAALHNPWVLAWRTARAALIVPLVEELFWRAWLMRWLIQSDFERVPLGTYASAAFWITALLFASEHGAYWDVGLIAGIVYNWWMVRAKSVGDCILMHGVTNLALSVYVIASGNWQYWQ